MKKIYQFLLISIVLSCSKDTDDLTSELKKSNQTTEVISVPNTSSNSVVNDYDGDSVADDIDYYPYNPFKTIDDWGQKVDQYPIVFTANDISDLNRQGIIEDLKLAADYFGKYEIEWWAVGQDIDAMLDLASKWCDRRIERGQLWYFEEFKGELVKLKNLCMSQTAHPHASLEWNNNVSTGNAPFTNDLSSFEGWMEEYRKIGLDLPAMSANAGMVRNSGYTATQSSFPFQYDPTTIPSGNDWIKKEEHSVMVFHEYYHILQAQNVFSKIEIVDETGNTVRPEFGPTAFTEGSANYISEYLIRKLANEGVYKGASKDFTLKQEMQNRMTQLKEMYSNCPDFKIENLNYGNQCDPYTFGQWAAAYLTNKVQNMYVFHDVFWPKINDMTFVGAFEDSFGMTYDQFNEEFKIFLNLPLEDQLAIIPDINFILD